MTEAELTGRRFQDYLTNPLLWLVLAAAIGFVIGGQSFGAANQRLIKLFIGLIFTYVILRYPLYISLGFYMIGFYMPTISWLGDTNHIIILFLTTVFAIKSGMRLEEKPSRTLMDWSIYLYITVHFISYFLAIDSTQTSHTITALRHLFIPIMLFYLLVHSCQNEGNFHFIVKMLSLGFLFVILTGLTERFFPNTRYLPTWFLSVIQSQTLFAGDAAIRTGGVVRQHNLLGDICAFNMILQSFLFFYYKKKPLLRTYHAIIALLGLFVLVTTINRGSATIAVGGTIYLIWLFRRRIKMSYLFGGLVTAVIIISLAELSISSLKGADTLITRFAGTTFENGIPDTRQIVWKFVWERVLDRPFFGHGPYYDTKANIFLTGTSMWPHSTYFYYAYTVGLIGVLIYLLMTVHLAIRTRQPYIPAGRPVSFTQGMAAVFHVMVVQIIIGEIRISHQRPDVRIIIVWVIFALAVISTKLWRAQRQMPVSTSSPGSYVPALADKSGAQK